MSQERPTGPVEELYFAGWINPLARSGTQWAVLYEEGKEVLAHLARSDAGIDHCLTCGDLLRDDYTISASVCLIDDMVTSSSDDYYQVLPLAGVVFRYQDLRRYYFYGFQGFDRLVLYCREDEEWTTLDQESVQVAPGKWHDLRVELHGSQIRAFMDGEMRFEVEDDTFRFGRAGLRCTMDCRYDRVCATATPRQQTIFLRTLSEGERTLIEMRERYPQPVLWKKVDLADWGSPGVRFGDLTGQGRTEILVGQGDGRGYSCITAATLEGEVLWQAGRPRGDAGSAWLLQIGDVDGDGRNEVVAVIDRHLVLMEGATGAERGRAPLPPPGPLEPKEAVLPVESLYLVDFFADGKKEIVLKGRYRGAAAYNHRLEMLWYLDTVDYGHHLAFGDLNGDGREEAMIGHNCVDGSGAILWRTRSVKFRSQPYHPDCLLIADFNGDGAQEVAMVLGNGGFVLVDASGNILSRHVPGHAQTLAAGRFVPEMEGLQIWTCTRWGNYGIRTLYDGRGKVLYRFEPDNQEGAGAPCNWTGDGVELALYATSSYCFGLYDHQGRCVVCFPDDGHPIPAYPYGRCLSLAGDARDEVVISSPDALWIYTQDRSSVPADRIYAPIRKWHQQTGGYVSYPRWKRNS